MLVVTGLAKPKTKYGWLCNLLEWINTTRHNLITPNLWPKPETTTIQELNTMPMHDKQWGTYSTSWNTTKNTANVKPWPDSSRKQTTPRSIYTAATADQSDISYDTHTFQRMSSQK
jgi:hypothetical protein